jgi:hypothetical protein
MSTTSIEARLARDLPVLADELGALPPDSVRAETPASPSPGRSLRRVLVAAAAAAVLVAVAMAVWSADPDGISTERVAIGGVDEPEGGFDAEISIDKYSGMPNPRWPLSDEELSSILELVDRLPAGAPEDRRPQLGFRGVQITFDEPGGLAILGVFGDHVHLERADGRVTVRRDDDHEVMRAMTARIVARTDDPRDLGDLRPWLP